MARPPPEVMRLRSFEGLPREVSYFRLECRHHPFRKEPAEIVLCYFSPVCEREKLRIAPTKSGFCRPEKTANYRLKERGSLLQNLYVSLCYFLTFVFARITI
jgi:hypothetical protein